MQTRLPNGQIVYEEDYSCIIEPQNDKGGIFIGNLEAAQNIKTLKKHGIRALLTAAKGVQINHSKSEVPFYLQVPGEDHQSFDLARYFGQSIKFIQDALQNTNIMVHCLAGVSRSVCLVLSFLIKNRGYSYDEAYRLVKSRRSIIHPNDGFIEQLRKLEMQTKMSPQKQAYLQPKTFSPSKTKYDYFSQEDQNFSARLNPENYTLQRQNNTKNGYYQSPSKRPEQKYSPYASPSKRTFHEIGNRYDLSSRNLQMTPPKARKEFNYSNTSANFGLDKFQSYSKRSQISQIQQRIQPRHFSPDRKNSNFYLDNRGRTISKIEPKTNLTNIEAQRVIGSYDKFRNTSTAELSQELDNKIAAIRQKYSDYTKNQMSMSRRSREAGPRNNNYLDQNEVSRHGLKRMTSDLESFSSKYGDFGMISPGLNRASISGIGLKKMNSLREGY